MTSDHTKPGVTFWATVGLVVVLVGYPLSFGPWIWYVAHYKPSHAIRAAGDATFAPLKWLARNEMLPEWYLHHIDTCVAAGIHMNHHPIR